MAKPFYSSGDSFRMKHDFLSCYLKVDFSTSHLLLSDFIFSVRQVISSISDYRFGFAMMHTYPSILEKLPNLRESCSIEIRRIFLNEYLIPYTSAIAACIGSDFPLFIVKDTPHSYGYACVFCLDYEQISFQSNTAFQNVNGITSSVNRKLLQT